MGKKCSKCKETKALSEFNTRPDRKSGYRSECKRCQYQSQHKERKLPKPIIRAYGRFRYALRKGRIQKPMFCEYCGQAKKLQAHHADYKKPFEVEWVCQRCHNIISRGKIA